mgnify:CR=1 FL=1|tara:strand:- start:108 stop:938 length:831 start_codon:yes stop_codon:yes gene_type:complete
MAAPQEIKDFGTHTLIETTYAAFQDPGGTGGKADMTALRAILAATAFPAFTIDVTNVEAFLVRKAGDAGDIFVIDTSAENHILNSTLDVATGNEVALSLNYTVNKATSGNDTGLKINQTDTSSPGTSLLLDLQVAGATKFSVDNAGLITSKKTEYFEVVCFDATTDCETGDGAAYFHIPPELDGMNLVYVHVFAVTAGTTGTMDIQVHNVDNVLDMLSTKLTVDSTETKSATAAAPAVIDTSNDHVNTDDIIRIDFDAAQTTAAKGAIVTLGFQTP